MNPRRVTVLWWIIVAVIIGVVLSRNYLVPLFLRAVDITMTNAGMWVLAPSVLIIVCLSCVILGGMIYYGLKSLVNWLRELTNA